MNLASALIKQVLSLQDFETWTATRKHYLPEEYHTLFTLIETHIESYHTLPTFEDLELSIRDAASKEKLLAVKSLDVEADAYMILEYLKNEFTQNEVL